MLVLLLAALLGACALFIVTAPLFSPGRTARSAAETGGLVEREAMAKQALREVEFDHQLGNLAEDDYRALRERYMRRALAAMKGRYDRERTVDDIIETQVRALRDVDAAKAAGRSRASNSRPSSTAKSAAPDRSGAAGSGSARKRTNSAKRGKGRG
jgi:hypothetical protein